MIRIDIPELFRSDFVERYYLHSDAARAPIRVGVLADGMHFPAPFAVVLDQIRRSNFARVELLLVREPEPERPAPPPANVAVKLFRTMAAPARRRQLAFSMYSRWDQKRFAATQELLSLIDCTSLLTGVEQIPVQPIIKGFVHRFPNEVVRHVKDRNIDVLLRFGFNIIRGDILSAARYGMWSYHHGDNDLYRGGPSHFWELFEDNPCSGVVLQVLTEELDNGIILDKAVARTETTYSHSSNRVRPYVLGSQMMIRALHDLHQHGWEHLCRRAFKSAEYRGQQKIYRGPDNADMARFALTRVRKAVTRRLTAIRGEHHWRLGIRAAKPTVDLPDSIDGFRWIESPAGRYYADPFLFSRGGRIWAFFEDCLYGAEHGRIACAELTPDGNLGEVQTVLDCPWHLSYPFVFEHQGEVFMIPASWANTAVDLYRATDFPRSWKREKTLLATGGLDTTICRRDGKMWLFTTLLDPLASDHRLFLFHSDDLFGEWQFHPLNPISADVRNARCAGAFVTIGDRLIRPAQDGSVRYGYATHFQEVSVLNTHEYAEKLIGSILPQESKGIYSVHTYSRAGGFEAIDGTVLRKL